MWGPGACPGWGDLAMRIMESQRNRLPPGQAQGPRPSPRLPLVPTGRVRAITLFVC
jgi:hypothetical protein